MALCLGLEITEIFSYYEESSSEQFIEMQNTSGAEINMLGCGLRYKNKIYYLPEYTLMPSDYYTYHPDSFALTKDPTSELSLEIIDGAGQVVDSASYSHGQKKGLSYMLAPDGEWRQTYMPTPGSENIYQEFQTCEEGKEINPETGNCIKKEAEPEAVVCAEGQYLNPLTNRCKKVEETSIAECKEGYERNPETNRCRKIVTTNADDYAPVNTGEAPGLAKKSFSATYALVAALILGVLYIIFQYRKEILGALRRLKDGLKRIKKLHLRYNNR